ncbi:arginine-binding protein [Thomasclavelia cocleata]|uniref:Amino acid ABC transporter substrate-binding protein, PAAT family n=1 Tax=Thomasclavelia cocleata TaxID=69824 RepID=A0A1I0EL42_9FIRM|nr:transporter substrate-binding domain-containing protein [Thomasclavelia cocleata]MCR1961219.1 transporter substrate-binding domain-containing protein [Thomasclavelia cocleata]NDO41632.1 transporter substrate-binding domain-containing protein [Thomasclavelia cocleata]PJN80769.1 arginine-binding protein [Thomasclavelia cocleata]SET46159.1 amino acid ABC transporter substrate-binding protein, PAAT family [Thomasclavelia cocleata]
MKKIIKVLLVCMMAVSLTACGGSSKKKILIGISPDYPPYESLKGDEMIGFDIDMTKELFAIMKENGDDYEYEFKKLSFDTISTSLIADQIDLGISGFTYHKEWEDVIWSDKYNDSRQVALVANDSSIVSAKDLEGKNIGAQLASTGEGVANEIKDANVKAVKDVKVLIETLNSGGIDAIILDEAVAKNYVKEAGYRMLKETLLEEENLIITNKNNQDLMDDINEALKIFVESDKYQELKTKWGA